MVAAIEKFLNHESGGWPSAMGKTVSAWLETL